MTLLYDPEKRYRRRRTRALLRNIFLLAVLAVAMIFAYQAGVEETKGREERLKAEIDALELANTELERGQARADAALETAERALEDLQQRMPSDGLLHLNSLLAIKLEEGVPMERLEFLIESAAQPLDCTGPETKRFILATPAYSGPNTSVAFADGRITVGGMGENALSLNGGVLGWFDPEKPVTITFTVIDGEHSEVSGDLPLHHSILLDDEEYRFMIAAGEQSLVSVTTDRCALPSGEDEAAQ